MFDERLHHRRVALYSKLREFLSPATVPPEHSSSGIQGVSFLPACVLGVNDQFVFLFSVPSSM